VETHEGQPMTMYRIKSWRWYPHDWLRYMLPWRVRQNSARVLDSFKPDVVHFQSHLIVGGGLTKEAQLRGIRIIGTNHFMPENMMQFTLLPGPTQRGVIRLVWKAAARTFGRAEAVTTPTRRAANFLEEYTHLTDVHAISCGINAHHYTPNFDTDGENRIVFVGRITGEKKLDVLLKAFRKLPPELNASLEFVGGGDQLQPMKQLVAHLGLSDKVTFTGYVSDDELKASLTRAKVFAMPSIAELQSIATMEAMATALPIVGANAMALPHLIHDGENGYLFEPNDVDDLRDKLVTVLTADKEELLRMKNNSLKFIRGHDITRTLDTFEALYRGHEVVDPDPELTDD
jgi:glycosyltransferase involved in cell wall biosynthesis